MSKPIYIYGAGGLGREIKAMIEHLNEWSLAGFYDDAFEKNILHENIPCMGGIEELKKVTSEIFVVIAIGNPISKLKIVNQLLSNKHIIYPVLIHPTVCLLDSANIHVGEGCILTAGTIVTTKVTIEPHTLVNLNTTIGHDVRIGKACSIMPGANIAGNVTLEEAVFIGSGANILNNVTIGRAAKVGAGAVVTKSVIHHTTVVGVPAKQLKIHKP